MSKLGEGGMSIVYKAYDLKKKKEVALKFLKKGITSSYIDDVIRFKREAEAISKLNHPSIIKLYGVGEHDNTPYLIEELLKGDSLFSLLNDGKTFTIKETIQIIMNITEALDYVHKNGIIHRDLKPGNLVIYRQKGNKYSIILLDFGMAYIMELAKIKDTSEVVGTFGYMSPEATGIVNRQVDERSDFYSLGIIMYQLLTGSLPFKSIEMNKLLHEQVAVEPKRLREINKNIPKILEEIVLKLLYKESELRYQSAQGLLHDLKLFQAGTIDFILGLKDQKTKLTYQTRLMGREEEIETIKSAYRKAKELKGNICLIGGEPGVGKTRLVTEIKEFLYEQGYEKGGLFIQGRCLNQENKSPYQPFRDSINEYIRKTEKKEKKERDKEINRLKEVLGDLGEIVIRFNLNMRQLLGDVPELISLDPERENQRFLMVVSDFFCHLTEKNKLCILFLDDLQWADEGSLGLLEEISSKISRSNLFIIGTYRNDEVNENHGLNRIRQQANKKGSDVNDIILKKLDKERVNKVVAGILGEKEDKAERLSNYVFDKSGGNPFFTVTLLRELVEEKALIWKEGYWKEDWDRINQIKISHNIIDLLLRRIDNLSEKQVGLLMVSSIIGREFKVELLYSLLEYEGEEIIELIDELIKVQMIERTKEKGVLIFVHDRIREAFIKKIEKNKIRKLHLMIAGKLEETNKARLDEVIFDLAFHYIEGGDKQKILEYVIPAANKAKINYANEDAIKYYKAGIKLLKKKSVEWIKAKEELSEVLLTIGRSNEAIKVLQEILPLKKDDLEKARIYRKIGTGYFKKGNWKKCESSLEQGLSILGEKLPKSKVELILFTLKEIITHILHSLFPNLFTYKGEAVKEEDKEIIWFYHTLNWMYILTDVIKLVYNILRSLNLSEARIGKSRELALCISDYASMCMAIPLFRRSINYHKKAIELKKQIKDEWGIAQSLQYMGYCYSWKGEHKKSRSLFIQSQEKFHRIGDMWELGMTINGWALEEYYLSHFNKSYELFTQYLKISQKINDDFGISSATENLTRIYIKRGDFEKAKDFAKKTLMMSKNKKIWVVYCLSNIVFGYLELENQHFNTAIEYLQTAIKLDKENDFLKNYVVEVYYLLADTYIDKLISKQSDLNISEQKREIKKIKRTCKIALSKTKQWKNHYNGALRVNGKYNTLINKNGKAEKYFLKCIELSASLKMKYDEAMGRYEYGIFLKEVNRIDQANEEWNKALSLFKEM
ncbi:MAG: protein kinase, partial [Spirochaetes bacterium]|nr:protein kinase [Spirochaetota bacterium]